MSGPQFKATITAIAIIPAAHVKNLTAEATAASKYAAGVEADSLIREQLNSLRQEHGPRVVLQCVLGPQFEEVS